MTTKMKLIKILKEISKLSDNNRLCILCINYVISLGLVLVTVDNYSIGLFFNWIRLKDIGLGLVILGCSFIVLLKHDEIKQNVKQNINKLILIGLGIILITILGDTLVRQTGLQFVYNLLLVLSFGLLFLTSTIEDIKRLFPYAVLIEAVSCIIQGILNYWFVTYPAGYFVGGIITGTGYSIHNNYCANYNMACGYMAFGFLFSNQKWQRILMPIMILAVYFTGSIEGIYITLGLLIWMIFIKKSYKDCSLNSIFYTYSFVLLFIIIWTIFGTGSGIWYRLSPLQKTLITSPSDSHEVSWKLNGLKYFINNIKLFGNGYEQIVSGSDIAKTVHNVPMIIAHQIGLIPAASWLVISVWCAMKVGIKKSCMWIGIGLMCLMDHYVWTTFALYWWLAVGNSIKEVSIGNQRTQ